MPSLPRNVLMMPVSSSRATQASVRSRKLMHMGSITSRYSSRWVEGFDRAMQ